MRIAAVVQDNHDPLTAAPPISLKIICPQEVLATSRIVNVAGRIKILTPSIRTRTPTRIRGTPVGTTCLISVPGAAPNLKRAMAPHPATAATSPGMMWLVVEKTYGNSPTNPSTHNKTKPADSLPLTVLVSGAPRISASSLIITE